MERYPAKYDDLDLLDALSEPRHKIGDIAFVKSEAIKGLTTPVRQMCLFEELATKNAPLQERAHLPKRLYHNSLF